MTEPIEDLLAFYALDALTEEERQQVEAYLVENPERRAELEGMKRAAGILPLGLEPVEPSTGTKQAILETVRREAGVLAASPVEEKPTGQPERRARSQWLPAYALGGASLLVALLAGALVFTLNVQVNRLRAELAAMRAELAAQRDEVALIADSLSRASESGLKTFPLSGTEHQPEAQGQLIADPGSNSGVLVVSQLAPLASGQTYQVWLIQDETPVSAGLLEVDDQGGAVMILQSEREIGDFQALGVSIEPEGGSPQPTGDIVILSEIS